MVVFAMKSSLGDAAAVEEIFAGSIPFIVMLFIALAVVIAYPPLCTWLPSLT